jgi:5-methylcytosine-specific restriction endonuclease McrA
MSTFPKEVIDRAMKRARHRCEAETPHGRCTNTDKNSELQAHHKKPVEDGGSNTPGNCQILCTDHHARKHPGQRKLIRSGGKSS